MSGDNRTVATDALYYVGTVLSEDVKRDAVHFAVEPIVLGERGLRPGDEVGRLADGTFGRAAEKPLGIIDPFIPKTGVLNKGDRVFLFIEPGTIRSLRHVWEHPEFPDVQAGIAPSVEQSREIMADWASRQPPIVSLGVLDPQAQRRKESREWIENYAKSFGSDYDGQTVTYDELIEGAREYVRYGTRLCLGGLFEGEWTSGDFWVHWEIVTGESAGADFGENFFSCSC